MNKPLLVACSCIAMTGLIILGLSVYFTVVYGSGNLEAGNFHRCVYHAERDPVTGAIHRSFDTRWDLVSSTEGSPLAEILDMWVLSIVTIIAGVGLYVADWATPRRRDF